MGKQRAVVGRGFFAQSARIMPAHAHPALTPPTAVATEPTQKTSPAGEPDPRFGRYEQDLARHARDAARHAHVADRDAAVEAGMLAQIRANTGPTAEDDGHADVGPGVTAETARCADAISRQGNRLDIPAEMDWTPFGMVMPVLAASPGAGASVVAAAVADAAQIAGLSVLLIDTADPVRSGLNRATTSDGPQIRGPHPAVRIRLSWRGQALVARAETTLPVLTPGMLPAPRFWQPGQRHLELTVVDIGHDPWRVAAHPLAGAGAWMRRGTPMPRPLLAVRPSVPSLAHAEQILARLHPWVETGAATAPAQLVVVGAKTWPRGIAGTAGRRTQPLLADAIFLPHDRDISVHGITATVTPTRTRKPLVTVLRAWGIQPVMDISPIDAGRRPPGENHAVEQQPAPWTLPRG